MLVLDSGGVSRLAERSTRAAALITVFRRDGLWPPTVPSVVLVESLTGRGDRDANTNRFLKTCDVEERLDSRIARRAAALRSSAARRGSAVDAVVVAMAEPGGTVLMNDLANLKALAARAENVHVDRA